MRRHFQIELAATDLFQLLDGLEARAKTWEMTARYFATGACPEDFLPEECSGGEEATKIGRHYRSIIAKIQRQIDAQQAGS